MNKLRIILTITILTITVSHSFSQETKVNGSLEDECKYVTGIIERFVNRYQAQQDLLMVEGREITTLELLGKMKAALETQKIICR